MKNYSSFSNLSYILLFNYCSVIIIFHRFTGILTDKDLDEIDPIRSKFLKQLRELANRKSKIAYDSSLSLEAKTCQIQNLSLNDSTSESAVRLEDLAVTFTYLPSSRVFGFSSADLIKNGSDIEV